MASEHGKQARAIIGDRVSAAIVGIRPEVRVTGILWSLAPTGWWLKIDPGTELPPNVTVQSECVQVLKPTKVSTPWRPA